MRMRDVSKSWTVRPLTHRVRARCKLQSGTVLSRPALRRSYQKLNFKGFHLASVLQYFSPVKPKSPDEVFFLFFFYF